MRTTLPLLALCFFASILVADEVKDLTARAAKGDAVAQFELARRYATGNGVAKDDVLARQWYEKAAAQGHAGAEVSLGSIYAHGFGVQQDWTESIRWYRRAAFQGNTTAQHNLGLDYAQGHGVAKDPVQAARWFGLAAEQGHARAQYNLGELFEDGNGLPQSDLEAYVLYHRAALHDNLEHLFGQAKMVELLQKRDRVARRLTAEQLAEGRKRIRAAEMLEAVHPRRFGTPGGIGPSRGWFIWRKYDPATGVVEVSREDGSEVWTARVLPWATTYRYLVYGVRPESLLPGERVNVFFSPDENHRRGYVVHFQDEIGQMKGHGHYWRVVTVLANGQGFTARVMAGDKPLDDRVLSFTLGPEARAWHAGKPVDRYPLKPDEKLYLTWVLRDGRPTVVLQSDEASLEAIRQAEAARLAEQLAADGMLGRVESVDGDLVHCLVISNHWQQANQLAAGAQVMLRAPGNTSANAWIPAVILERKNRGTYGSGVNDLRLRLDRPADAAAVAAWPWNTFGRLRAR